MTARPLRLVAVAAFLIAGLGTAGASCAQAAGGPPAYVVNEINVTDPVKFKIYADQALATIQAFGGEFIVRGGNPQKIAGPAPATRMVIVKFPNRAAALAWRASKAYQAILPIREASSTSTVFVVDGVAP